MPNWCHNRLTVTGPAADVASFVGRAEGYGPVYKQSESQLKLERRLRAEGKATEPEAGDAPPNPLSFHSLVPVPPHLLARTYGGEEEAAAAGGRPRGGGGIDPGWCGYDWEVVHWGCKWGAAGCTRTRPADGEAVYAFATAWGPPVMFAAAASALFPSLTLRLAFEEPNMCIAGWVLLRAGRVVDGADASAPMTPEEVAAFRTVIAEVLRPSQAEPPPPPLKPGPPADHQ